MKDPRTNTDWNQDLFMLDFRRTVLVDFDGVLHRYSQGWKGPTAIYDSPVPGAINFLRQLLTHSTEKGEPAFDVQIYSSRSRHPEGPEAMRAWLYQHGLTREELDKIGFPTDKPAAWLTIDDRCWQFRGRFPTPEFILHFDGWTKRPELIQQASGEVSSDAEELRRISYSSLLDLTPKERELLRRIANELEGVHL